MREVIELPFGLSTETIRAIDHLMRAGASLPEGYRITYMDLETPVGTIHLEENSLGDLSVGSVR